MGRERAHHGDVAMEIVGGKRRRQSSPAEWVVYDGLTRCPYIRGQIARLPMRLPERALQPRELEERLAAGDRRQGMLLYRPRCPLCSACEPIRLRIGEFEPSSAQRRALRSGDRALETRLGRPRASREKVALYNAHKQGRGLWVGDDPIDLEGYEEFLVETCVDSIELEYRLDGRLVGAAISDRSENSLSAVYCFYDPSVAQLSIGTYSIMKQLELCRSWGLDYLYLGLYVAECSAMAYKSRYTPHERLIQGQWQRFPSDATTTESRVQDSTPPVDTGKSIPRGSTNRP